MDFSNFLKTLIKKRGYSYRELGKLSCVNHTYVSKICRGTSGKPSPEILRKLSGPLCMPYEELLKAAGYLLSENAPSYPAGAEDDLFLRITRLTPEGKSKITEFLDYVEDWEKKQRKKEKSLKKQEG